MEAITQMKKFYKRYIFKSSILKEHYYDECGMV